MPYVLSRNAPHAYAHARPWDTFKGRTQVGAKETGAHKVFKPGHKKNALFEGDDADNPYVSSAAAYGAAYNMQRAPASETMRRQFGRHAMVDNYDPPSPLQQADVLGPVDLSSERQKVGGARQAAVKAREEAPVDTLRWNPAAGESGRGELTAARRLRLARLEAAELNEAASAAGGGLQSGAALATSQARASSESIRSKVAAARERADVPADTLRGGSIPGRARSEAALRLEAAQEVRQQLEQERLEAMTAAREAEAQSALASRAGVTLPARESAAYQARFGVLETERAKSLMDPRVQKALDAALNAPNSHMFAQNKGRNTQRISAERKF